MRNTLVYPTKDEVIECLKAEREKYLGVDAPIGGTQAMCLSIAIDLVERSDYVG